MKHKAIPKKLRQQVYDKYGGHCAYCGCELERDNFQVDHAKSLWHTYIEKRVESNFQFHDDSPEANQDDSIENLMPACKQCNYYKDSMDIENFRKAILETLSHTCIDTFATRLAMKYGMITYTPWDGKFYFEKQETKLKE